MILAMSIILSITRVKAMRNDASLKKSAGVKGAMLEALLYLSPLFLSNCALSVLLHVQKGLGFANSSQCSTKERYIAIVGCPYVLSE